MKIVVTCENRYVRGEKTRARVSDEITTVVAIRFQLLTRSQKREENFPTKSNKSRLVCRQSLTLLEFLHLENPLDLVSMPLPTQSIDVRKM